jgi:hypothetical protein
MGMVLLIVIASLYALGRSPEPSASVLGETFRSGAPPRVAPSSTSSTSTSTTTTTTAPT